MPEQLPVEHLTPIEIDVNGAWRPGRLRSWEPRQDGLWADVLFETDHGEYLGRTLPAERVRPIAS